MTLATIEEAKLQLHITDPAREPEVQMFLQLASAVIYQYIGAQALPEWDETTAPDDVRAATLKMLGHLHEHRGDDASDSHDEKIWEGISLLLMRRRDPALA
jgi:hypothetical protein